MALLAEFPEGPGIHLANRVTARAKRTQLVATKLIDKHFTEYAARGISGAQDQYIHHLVRTMANRLNET